MNPDFLQLFPFGRNTYKPASNTFAICALAVLVGFTLFLIVKSIYRKKYWESGIFPPHLKFSNENMMYAQACMAALIVRSDRNMILDKMLFVDSYFRTQFRDVRTSYRTIYTSALGTPIKSETVAAWIEKHNISEEKRIQFVQFLMNLSLADGMMNRMEFVTISKFIESLKLNQSILNDFVNANYEKHKREQQPYRSKSSSALQRHTATLGLTETATKAEIKQTYRRLVKLYHPDRFAQENEQVLLKAKEKFQELQEAYDWLISN